MTGAPNPTSAGTWDETRAALRRLRYEIRWWFIEWHLGRVVRLIRPDDPGALPLLDALAEHYRPVEPKGKRT